MGIIDTILGNAAQANTSQTQREYQEIFIPNEEVQAAFRMARDMIIFTNRRLILVDKQGLTGKKVEYFVVPYKSIKYFSVETAGRFDRDAELKIWVSSSSAPTISKTLKKGLDIVGLQKTLTYFIVS